MISSIPQLPKIKKRSIATKLIRLEFNSSLCEYYTELDAVRLEGYVWSKGKKPSFLYKKRVFESVKIEVSLNRPLKTARLSYKLKDKDV